MEEVELVAGGLVVRTHTKPRARFARQYQAWSGKELMASGTYLMENHVPREFGHVGKRLHICTYM